MQPKCSFVSTFSAQKARFEKINVQSPFGWDQNATFWKKLHFGFVKRKRKMGKELRAPFWKKLVRVYLYQLDSQENYQITLW